MTTTHKHVLGAIALCGATLGAHQATPRYLTTGLFIASIEEGARIFTPARLLPLDHPEALGHEFPTVLQLHGGEDQVLLVIGQAAGLRLAATLQRYPTEPDTLWPYAPFSRPPLAEIRAAPVITLPAADSPLPGLRALAVVDRFPVSFIVDTRGLSLADRHMGQATTMGLDLSRAEFLAALSRAAQAAPASGAAVIVYTAGLAVFVPPAAAQDLTGPTALDSADLRTIAAVVAVFGASRDSVWPGYDLSARPALVYRPGRWAVVLNPPGAIDGYQPYPDSWPRLGAPALLHLGATPDLVGQLEFDFPVGGVTTVAIPLADELLDPTGGRARSLFAFVVHEAFHQFQRSAFREANEPSEERYPILDTANNARAALEIFILEDAMRAVARGDSAGVRRLTGLFLAQRRFRWDHAVPLVRELERAKELSEGTAKYVETRLVAQLASLCRAGRFTDASVCPSFRSVTVPGYLRTDFESRLTNRALGPADVPRNRIYPTGAAMGVLLDFSGAAWKPLAALLPDSSTLADLLALPFPVPAARLDALRREAEQRYDWPGLERRTRALVDAYVREAGNAIRAFEAQPGIRVEVQLPAAGTSRSRSSTARRWVVDDGRRVFGGDFLAYTLRRPDGALLLTVERRAVLDDLVESGERRVACFVPAVDSIVADGAALSVTAAGDHRFEHLRLRGAGVSLDVRVPGTLSVATGRVAVRLSPRAP